MGPTRLYESVHEYAHDKTVESIAMQDSNYYASFDDDGVLDSLSILNHSEDDDEKLAAVSSLNKAIYDFIYERHEDAYYEEDDEDAA